MSSENNTRLLLVASIGVVYVARQFGIRINVDAVEGPIKQGDITSFKEFDRYFLRQGVLTKLRSLKPKEFLNKSYLFPAVCLMKDGGVFILVGADSGKAQVVAIDPTDPTAEPKKISLSEFAANWSGKAIFVSKFSGESSKDRTLDWKWVLPELYRFKWVLAVTLLIALLLHALSIIPIIYIQIALDKVISNEAVSTLYLLTGGVVSLIVFTGFLTYGRDYVVNHISSVIESRLVGDVFDKLMDLPADYFQRRSSGDIEGSVNSVVTIRTFISRHLLGGFFEVVGLFVFIPLLIGYSPVLALLVVSFALLQGLIELASKLRQSEVGKSVAKSNRQRVQTLRETVASMDAVKSLGQQTAQRRQWRSSAARSIRYAMKMFHAQNVATSINATLSSLMTIAIVFTGITLVFAGNLSTGAIISCTMLGSKVIGPTKRLLTFFADLGMLRSSMDQVSGIWNAAPERIGLGTQHVLRGQYKFNEVSVRLGDAIVLKGLNLEIPARKKIAIVGPSASGKSILLRLFQGLIRPSDGFVEVDGINLSSIDLSHYRSQVALVNANNTFFAGTIEENIRRVRHDLSSREMDGLLDDSGLADLIRYLPQGLSTEIDLSAANLSKSYQIIVALARALASTPNLLLLDDCFSNLDRPNQLKLRNNLPRIATGRTVIATIQDMRFAKEFDWLIVLEQGKVVGQGNHADLLVSSEPYQQLFELEGDLDSSAKIPQSQGR